MQDRENDLENVALSNGLVLATITLIIGGITVASAAARNWRK